MICIIRVICEKRKFYFRKELNDTIESTHNN